MQSALTQIGMYFYWSVGVGDGVAVQFTFSIIISNELRRSQSHKRRVHMGPLCRWYETTHTRRNSNPWIDIDEKSNNIQLDKRRMAANSFRSVSRIPVVRSFLRLPNIANFIVQLSSRPQTNNSANFVASVTHERTDQSCIGNCNCARTTRLWNSIRSIRKTSDFQCIRGHSRIGMRWSAAQHVRLFICQRDAEQPSEMIALLFLVRSAEHAHSIANIRVSLRKQFLTAFEPVGSWATQK